VAGKAKGTLAQAGAQTSSLRRQFNWERPHIPLAQSLAYHNAF